MNAVHTRLAQDELLGGVNTSKNRFSLVNDDLEILKHEQQGTMWDVLAEESQHVDALNGESVVSDSDGIEIHNGSMNNAIKNDDIDFERSNDSVLTAEALVATLWDK